MVSMREEGASAGFRVAGPRGIAATAILAAALGCTLPPVAPPGSLDPPAVDVHVGHFTGSPLSGPLPEGATPGGPANALSVRLTFFALEDFRRDVLEPLAKSARLIAPGRGPSAFTAATSHMAGARAGTLEDAGAFIQGVEQGDLGRSARLAELCGALPAEVTAVFDAHGPSRRGGASSRRFEIQIHRPPGADPNAAGTGGIEVAVVVEAMAVVQDERDAERAADAAKDAESKDEAEEENAPAALAPAPSTPPSPVLQREMVLLDPRPAADRDQLAILFPSPFESDRIRAMLAVIDVAPPPAEDAPDAAAHADAFARCVADLDASAAKAREETQEAPRVERPVGPALARALEGLSFAPQARPVLVFLADATGARLTEDLVLSAPEPVIARLAEAVRKATQEGEAYEGPALALTLEKTTIAVLADLMANGELPTALEGIPAIHAGEAGRSPSILQEVAAGARSLDDLRDRLVRENLLSLEDSSPSARMRAYDWLAAREKAPAGYDPLASDKERRAALESAASAVEEGVQ
ncbi:MAG: hypothetical protein JXP34_21805 [Planctomycetes bacterium]|nr:hypothetical protein [Planctomycetota bacterium]